MAEQSNALDSSSGVSDQQSESSSPGVLTFVSLSETLNHYCFIHRIRRLAVRYVTQEPTYTLLEKGFSLDSGC